MNVVCIYLIFTYKGTKNISLLQLFGHFSYIELTLNKLKNQNLTEEKLDEKTQFENKDNAKKTTTDDYLDKLGQKYNENRIGDLEVEVKQLRKDFDNLKATIAKLDKLQVGGVALNEVLEQIIANIIIKTYAK